MRYLDGLKEIILRLSDNEYSDCVIKGQSMYRKRVKRRITEEEYAKRISYLANTIKDNV